MGIVKKNDEAEAAATTEDTPIVKELKELDDKYMAIEKEFDAAVMKLQLETLKLQHPILAERSKILLEGDANEKSGTPAVEGFWLKAIKNHPELGSEVQTWDEPVLAYLKDITKELADETNVHKGFKLIFHFAPNPYFTNETIEKEHLMTEDTNPYNGGWSPESVKTSVIDWKAGKNVTVEMVAKKPKKGKKGPTPKKEEPRESFFREFFRSLYPGCSDFEELKQQMFGEMGMDDDEDDEDEEMLGYLMEEDAEKGNTISDYLIPYATRWLTGEAVPENFERDDDDDEDDEDEDEDEDEESEEEDDEPKGSSKKGGAGGDGKKQEECKQQ